jgi:hypothetical protein
MRQLAIFLRTFKLKKKASFSYCFAYNRELTALIVKKVNSTTETKTKPMNKISLRLVMFFLIFFAGITLTRAQQTERFADLIVKAPGLDISKSLENIKTQLNSVHGLSLIAAYKKSDMLHFRIDRQMHADNSVVYTLFPDLTFTIIEDREEVKALVDEATLPKNDIATPAKTKTE